METLVSIRNVKKYFRAKTDVATLFSKGTKKAIKAVDHVSFQMFEGETLGLVGESGSGKTTIGRLLVRLDSPDSGKIFVDNMLTSDLTGKGLKGFYRRVQMIFQDPYASVNPRFTVMQTLLEPIKVQKLCSRGQRSDKVLNSLDRSGLKPPSEYINKFPHELSGGERQRLSIARALVMDPKVLVADEPVSMLDVSIKAGILNLLKSLSYDERVAILYISHDLSTVKYLCDRIILMYLGKFMEVGPSDEVIDRPLHPYAQALRAAIPVPDPNYKRERVISESMMEKYVQSAKGCRYESECRYSFDICSEEEPNLREIESNHFVACHLC